MTLNIDLAPTVLEIAGIDVPATMQGRSIVPLVEDKDAGWRQEWFYEHHFTARGWIPRTEGIRTDRWKYTNFIDEQPPFEELYDLEHDRFEERNLANEKKHHDQLAFLRARREIWIQALARWTPETRWQDPAGRL
jgi:arylsulfatase A-like enzyme